MRRIHFDASIFQQFEPRPIDAVVRDLQGVLDERREYQPAAAKIRVDGTVRPQLFALFDLLEGQFSE